MKTAIAPCESDPRGNRCVEDFANHAMCPIDILYNGKVVNDDGSIDPSYGDFKKHMEDIRKELDIELELLLPFASGFFCMFKGPFSIGRDWFLNFLRIPKQIQG